MIQYNLVCHGGKLPYKQRFYFSCDRELYLYIVSGRRFMMQKVCLQCVIGRFHGQSPIVFLANIINLSILSID